MLPNRQSSEPLLEVVVAENDHGNRFTVWLKADVILRMRRYMWSLTHDCTLFLEDNSIYLNRTAIQVIALSDLKYVGNCPPLRIGHVIRRMRSVCKRILSSILWEISKLMLHKIYGLIHQLDYTRPRVLTQWPGEWPGDLVPTLLCSH